MEWFFYVPIPLIDELRINLSTRSNGIIKTNIDTILVFFDTFVLCKKNQQAGVWY